MSTHAAAPSSGSKPKSEVSKWGEGCISLQLSEPQWRRWARYEDVSLECRENYFAISTRPLTPEKEDDLELVSGVVSGEDMREMWDEGVFECARCHNTLYKSQDKWAGPCIWPSFRAPADPDNSLLYVPVEGYNSYNCIVEEVYCKRCELFLGHSFEDGVAKGDKHPDARWRH
mmetsp:Transcript_14384/g.25767  ORF Transcript_14384/g.25767 Transcript_14384/m.25767 type:complete len:173 (-) Transcript_14384:397-915(-)